MFLQMFNALVTDLTVDDSDVTVRWRQLVADKPINYRGRNLKWAIQLASGNPDEVSWGIHNRSFVRDGGINSFIDFGAMEKVRGYCYPSIVGQNLKRNTSPDATEKFLVRYPHLRALFGAGVAGAATAYGPYTLHVTGNSLSAVPGMTDISNLELNNDVLVYCVETLDGNGKTSNSIGRSVAARGASEDDDSQGKTVFANLPPTPDVERSGGISDWISIPDLKAVEKGDVTVLVDDRGHAKLALVIGSAEAKGVGGGSIDNAVFTIVNAENIVVTDVNGNRISSDPPLLSGSG